MPVPREKMDVGSIMRVTDTGATLEVIRIQDDGTRVFKQLPEGTKVFWSPTVRTQQTVLPLGRKFKLRDEISPQGTVEHALELAQWPTAKNTVVMVSHQPLIGQMVSLLFGLPSHEMMIKKGSVWWIRYKIKDEQPQITLLTVQLPELL